LKQLPSAPRVPQVHRIISALLPLASGYRRARNTFPLGLPGGQSSGKEVWNGI
jgi:hypothetical protein